MLRVLQMLTESQKSKQRLENDNHKDAIEYIPEAKGMTYTDLTDDAKCLYLVFTLPKSDHTPDSKDDELVNDGNYLPLLATIYNVLSMIRGIEIKSVSYNPLIEENASHSAIIAHCLILLTEREEFNAEEISAIKERVSKVMELCDEEVIPEDDSDVVNRGEMKEDWYEKELLQETFENDVSDQTAGIVSSGMEETVKDPANESGNDYSGQPVSSGRRGLRQMKDDEKTVQMQENLSSQKKEEGYVSTFMEGTESRLDAERNSEKPAGKYPVFRGQNYQADYVEEEAPDFFEGKKIKANAGWQKKLTSSDQLEDESNESFIPKLNRIEHFTPSVELENRELFYEIPDRFELTETTSSKEKLRSLFQQTITYFTTTRHTRFFSAQRQEITQEQFMSEVREYMDRHLSIPAEDTKVFLEEVYNAVFSYYKITDAIADDRVSDIKILGPDKINVKVYGKHYTLKGTRFISLNDYIVFIQALIARNRVMVSSPIILFTDTEYHKDYALRFNLTMPDINTSKFPVLHVRKVEKNKMFKEDLVKAGMMPQKVADYLTEKTKTSSIVFAGPPASGKTKALNAFVEEIPYTEAGLCVQESDEIFAAKHPNLMCQHILRDSRGEILYGLDEIGTNGLVCDINWYIIGEIKGSEARTFLRASNTGNHVLCTIHSPNAKETIPRFADYIKYGSDYSQVEAERMLKDLEVIVYIEHFKVREIVEIRGYDEEKKRIIYETVYTLQNELDKEKVKQRKQRKNRLPAKEKSRKQEGK